jgi:hypothetical protein
MSGPRITIHRPDLDVPRPEPARPRGLGDAVALIAQPIARAIDRVAGTNVAGCGGCAKRRAKLNAMVPDLSHPLTPKPPES